MRTIIALLLTVSPALAQDYAPPSRDLWNQMVQALQQLPMSATAHQQMSQILQGVQAQALREAKPQEKPK
jgi:hypothetical protein